MSADSWKVFFDWGAVILLFLTFAFGAGALITGNVITKRQAARLRDFQTRLEAERQATAKAQEAAARAQLELKQYIERAEKQRLPRHLRFDPHPLLERLKDKPKGTVEILYSPNDESAWMFALQLSRWLGPGYEGDGLGWNVSQPSPISRPARSDGRPVAAQFGGTGSVLGLTVISPIAAATGGGPGSTLWALEHGLALSLGGGSLVAQGDSRLPANTFLIVVGQAP